MPEDYRAMCWAFYARDYKYMHLCVGIIQGSIMAQPSLRI